MPRRFRHPLLLGHTVTSTIGKDRLEGVQLAQVDSRMQPIAGTETLIPCDALLLSVGLIPENELALQAGIAIDEDNCGLAVDERLQTSAEGIFACGNAVSIHSLADYVTIQGRLAGRSAARFILTSTAGRVRPRASRREAYRQMMKQSTLTCIVCPKECPWTSIRWIGL